MKIPIMLSNYLDETEQDERYMNKSQLLREAQWVLYNYQTGEGYGTAKQAAALKRFIEKCKMEVIQ